MPCNDSGERLSVPIASLQGRLKIERAPLKANIVHALHAIPDVHIPFDCVYVEIMPQTCQPQGCQMSYTIKTFRLHGHEPTINVPGCS
jgi:hypothetical protein